MERAPGSPSPGAFWSIPSCGSWHWDTGMGRLLFPANVLQPKRRVLKTLERSASPFFSKLAPPPPKRFGRAVETGHGPPSPAENGPLRTPWDPPPGPRGGFFLSSGVEGGDEGTEILRDFVCPFAKKKRLPGSSLLRSSNRQDRGAPPPPQITVPKLPREPRGRHPRLLRAEGRRGGYPPCSHCLSGGGWDGEGGGQSPKRCQPRQPGRGGTHTLWDTGQGSPASPSPGPTVRGCGAPPGSAPALLALPPTTGGCSGAGCIIISY